MATAEQSGVDAQQQQQRRLHELLEQATEWPATQTMQWVPRTLQHRIGDLLTKQLMVATTALEGSPCRQRQDQLRLLWILPALLLRQPADQEGVTRVEDGKEAGSSTVAKEFRRRATLAENDQWIELLEEYNQEASD